MTLMIPNFTVGNLNRGESDIFNDIRMASASDSYICLHSLGIAKHERKEYAEADFVLIGPSGVYCIESKGGDVSRVQGSWVIGWPGNIYRSAEGPFIQSERTRYPLIRYIQTQTGLSRSDVLYGWGVAFPHIVFSEIGPDWDLDVVYDQRDRTSSFIKYVERLERYFRKRLAETGRPQPGKLSASRVIDIANSLRGDFTLVTTTRGLVVESKRELAALSAEQYRVLDFSLNDRNPQILCEGIAGSGKTLIAMEAARRISAKGFRVLFLCFNEQLNRFLAIERTETNSFAKVSTIYRFMAEFIRLGGFGLTLQGLSKNTPDLFEKSFPELFESAASVMVEESSLPQYDVIVLDEAQDILTAQILNCLDLILVNGFRGGRWLIFLDSGVQSDVYGRLDANILSELRKSKPAEFSLTENFRNPKLIVKEVCTLTGIKPPICRRELPAAVDYRVYENDKEEGQKLRALLVDLIREGVAPGAITILSCRARISSCVSRHAPEIGKDIVFIEDFEGACPQDCISASSVSGFKGLENEIIILTDLPILYPMNDWTRSILYVGMTRARTKLYAVVERAYIDERAKLDERDQKK